MKFDYKTEILKMREKSRQLSMKNKYTEIDESFVSKKPSSVSESKNKKFTSSKKKRMHTLGDQNA